MIKKTFRLNPTRVIYLVFIILMLASCSPAVPGAQAAEPSLPAPVMTAALDRPTRAPVVARTLAASAKELTAAASYHRYYAFYLSQGLKINGLLTVPNGDPPAGGWPAIVFNHG